MEQQPGIRNVARPAVLPPGIHLYELAPAFREAMRRLMEIDPTCEEGQAEIEALGQELQALGGAIEARVDNALAIYREFETTAMALTEEIERLSMRRGALLKRAEALKQYVYMQMKRAGLDRVDGARFTAAIRQNPEAVEVVDQAAIPSEFIRTRVIQEVDKAAIKAARRAGREIPGILFTRGERLEVR